MYSFIIATSGLGFCTSRTCLDFLLTTHLGEKCENNFWVKAQLDLKELKQTNSDSCLVAKTFTLMHMKEVLSFYKHKLTTLAVGHLLCILHLYSVGHKVSTLP